MQLLGDINNCLKVLTREGSFSLDPIFLDLVASVQTELDHHTSQMIDLQQRQKLFIEWMTSGRINRIFFRDLDTLPLIADPSSQNALWKVAVDIDDMKMTANVVFYDGRLLDIQMPVKRRLYVNRPYLVGAARKGATNADFTRCIDRSEHG